MNLATLDDHLRLRDHVQRVRDEREQMRLTPPTIRLWDGDYNYRGTVAGERKGEYEFVENDAGTATIELPIDHHLAQWVIQFKGRAKRNVHVTFDKQPGNVRWSGRMEYYRVVQDQYGDRFLEIVFIHDFEQLRHILVFCNPWFRADVVQFPKVWVIAGPLKFCLLTTLFVNQFRLESSWFTMPDNPTDPTEWMGPSFNVKHWRNVIKPFTFLSDNTPLDIVYSRFQTFFDVAQKALNTAQLTMVCRRYLKDEDEHPFSDLKGTLNIPIAEKMLSFINLRHGCLVWDVEDNSGFEHETVFGGSVLTGMVRTIVNIGSDGTTENINLYRGEPTYPQEYWRPGWEGTRAKAPWVVFRESPLSGIKSSEFKYVEAKSTSYIAGGESCPGLNELASSAVNAGGDILSAVINSALEAASGAPVGAIPVEMPSLGGIIDAVAKLLYFNSAMAFNEVPTTRSAPSRTPLAGLEDKLTSLGDFHLYEKRAGGPMKAFTASSSMAIRAEMWKERAHVEIDVQICDAAPYHFGAHYNIGDRIGVTVFGYPDPDTIFVERVKSAKYSWGEDGPGMWEIKLGFAEQNDPMMKLYDRIRDITQIGNEVGIW